MLFSGRGWAGLAGAFLIAGGFGLAVADEAAEKAAEANTAEASAAEGRLSESTKYLASDELEGRGIGTKGLDLAADYLKAAFLDAGLNVNLFEETPFQKFSVTTSSKLGPSNALTIVGPGEGDATQLIKLEVGQDFGPLAIGGSGQFRLPLAFVGYGITGRKEMYDDYADIDVKGKAVIVLRHEPQQKNPHSAFDGADHSRHAFFNTKVSNAYQHGAAAVVFVTDGTEITEKIAAARKRWQEALAELSTKQAEWAKIENPTREELEAQRTEGDRLAKQIQQLGEAIPREYDPVFELNRAGTDMEGRDLPVVHVRRAVIDDLIKKVSGKDLATIEAEIDKGSSESHGAPLPQSFDLTDWRLEGQTDVERTSSDVKNVIAVLEGEGPLADETIVIGAHYDHLGYGGPGSSEPTSKEIHNGADDNASGTAVLVEVARRLAAREKKLPRRVVFIAFTGEERGLLGSAHYARDPAFPLDKTVAMLNMDMVGRLQENKLLVHGIDTAKEFSDWLDELNKVDGEPSFHLIKKTGGFGPSDHATFYAKNIPVLHFFTGQHKEYHSPRDDSGLLDVNGMRRVADLVEAFAVKIAETSEKPTFQESKQAVAFRGGDRPYFGSIPYFSSEVEGYALSGVAKDSPADKAGIKGGDVVIKLGDSKIGNLEDIDGALRKHKAGDKVPVVVKRGNEELTLEVVLGEPR